MYYLKTIITLILFMLFTTSLARCNSFGESRGRRMLAAMMTATPGEVLSPLGQVNNQGSSEDTPTGSTGSAHGPNWDYGWGWGAGPRSGWGYGYGSSHSPTGFGRGYGFGFGSGSGSGSGSGYGYGSGGSGGAGGYGYGSGGAHGGSVGGGSFVSPPNHG